MGHIPQASLVTADRRPLLPGHAAGAQAVGQAVDAQLHQLALVLELLETQGALVGLVLLHQSPVGRRRGGAAAGAHPPSSSSSSSCSGSSSSAASPQRGPGRQLLHVEGAVDLELQRGGDRLHADHAAEARERVAQVGVHLAVLDELLLALQWHLADATRPRVQTLAVGDLRNGGRQRITDTVFVA